MTRRLRQVIAEALDELEAGNTRTATAILADSLIDEPVRDDTRCPNCHRWPGQQWSCPHVREYARLEGAA